MTIAEARVIATQPWSATLTAESTSIDLGDFVILKYKLSDSLLNLYYDTYDKTYGIAATLADWTSDWGCPVSDFIIPKGF